jgi:hypothetical protein
MKNHISPGVKYDTDPSSNSGLVLPVNVFDTARIQALIRAGRLQGIPRELGHPNDNLLIATVVDNGMPSWSADQMRYHPGLRLAYFMFWNDLQDAAQGDAEAKEKVDGARAAWAQMRKDELINDMPDMSVGMWER